MVHVVFLIPGPYLPRFPQHPGSSKQRFREKNKTKNMSNCHIMSVSRSCYVNVVLVEYPLSSLSAYTTRASGTGRVPTIRPWMYVLGCNINFWDSCKFVLIESHIPIIFHNTYINVHCNADEDNQLLTIVTSSSERDTVTRLATVVYHKCKSIDASTLLMNVT